MGKNTCKFGFSLLIILSFLFTQCKFDSILQPSSALPGEIIEIRITISDNLVPEPNAHKGLLCILIPDDWSFVSGSYDGTVGSGELERSASWADSAEACYPAIGFAAGMKWIALISDKGYAYDDPITIDIDVQLQVGQKEGCYELGYLVTKATQDLLCTNYSPLSYPHPIGIPDSCDSNEVLKTESSPEWDSLFDRTEGWTGSDGIYTIPMNGVEIPEYFQEKVTLMTFGDTFIGEVDSTNSRQNTRLINNTFALLNGIEPLETRIEFFWEESPEGAEAVFVPDTPESKPGDWYWPMDGLVIGDTVYQYALRLDSSADPFKVIGVNLLSYQVDMESGLIGLNQEDTPLFYENPSNGSEIVFGQAVMPATAVSGSHYEDGYIYLYGPRSSSLKKDVVAARFLPEDIRQFNRYQFWNGSGWGNSIADCATVTSFVSQEFSVSPLSDGRFLLTFQINESVAIRFGQSPVGPFDFYQVIWNCPEVNIDNDVFVYNAKAHPHLSDPGTLLISYNVNTHDFWDHFSNADIYRPRFIRLYFEDPNSLHDHAQNLLDHPVAGFRLSQNYPNPFNPETVVPFDVSIPGNADISVYDLNGRLVKRLADDHYTAGRHRITWNGRSQAGNRVSSGIYYVRMRMDDQIQTRKIILIK